MPVSNERMDQTVTLARLRMETFAELLGPGSDARFFEFGVGWDLRNAIALSAFGANRQIAIDRTPLASPPLMDDAIRRLRAAPAMPAEARQRLDSNTAEFVAAASAAAKAAVLGIEYRAPVDARSTNLPTGSIDGVISDAVLEHVPAADIPLILAECRRILRSGGIAIMNIDYGDHYSYYDPSINAYHFLRFDERHWRRYNSNLHYQNRLRHGWYKERFEQAGFEIVEMRPNEVSAADISLLHEARLDAEFARLEPTDVAIRNATFVVRKS